MLPSPLVLLSSPRTGHERAQCDPLTNDSRRCYPQEIFPLASTSPNQPSSAYAFFLVFFSLLRLLGYSRFIKFSTALFVSVLKMSSMQLLSDCSRFVKWFFGERSYLVNTKNTHLFQIHFSYVLLLG